MLRCGSLRVAELGLAQLEDSGDESVQLGVVNNRLGTPTLSDPQGREAMQLICTLLVEGGLGLILLGLERVLDHLHRRFHLAGCQDVLPLLLVELVKVRPLWPLVPPHLVGVSCRTLSS